MTGNALAVMQTLDHPSGDAHLDQLADQLMRYAVIVTFDINVVVN